MISRRRSFYLRRGLAPEYELRCPVRHQVTRFDGSSERERVTRVLRSGFSGEKTSHGRRQDGLLAWRQRKACPPLPRASSTASTRSRWSSPLGHQIQIDDTQHGDFLAQLSKEIDHEQDQGDE